MQIPSWRFGAGIALVFALVGAAGCGGSDKESVQNDVNDICADFRKETKSLFEGQVESPEEFAAQGKKALPAIQKADRELTQVKASEDVRKELGTDYTRFVQNFRRTAQIFRVAIQAADQGNTKALGEFAQEIGRLDRESDAQARKLGFDECAKD